MSKPIKEWLSEESVEASRKSKMWASGKRVDAISKHELNDLQWWRLEMIDLLNFLRPNSVSGKILEIGKKSEAYQRSRFAFAGKYCNLNAKALGDKKAAILKNHGLLTTGESVDAALWAFLSMDRCCQSQLIAESAGQMERISDEVAELTKSQVGSEFAMWASFQPIYDLMLEKDDSFLN